MILGVDPGMAKCGWAVVRPRTGELVELGVITTEVDNAIDVTVDRARRIAIVGAELAAIRQRHGADVAGEQALGHGTVHAVIPQVLCWGALVQLAAAAGVALLEVTAKAWQHAVTPGAKKISYPVVEKKLTCLAGAPLQLVPPGLRNHAIDGFGVALIAALRPHLARRVLHAAPRAGRIAAA